MKMKRSISVSIFLIAAVSCRKTETTRAVSMVSGNAVMTAQASPLVYTAVRTAINDNCAGFMQAVPADYNTSAKKYPLIVFIHGIGELGTNVTALNCCGLPYHLCHKTFPPVFRVSGVDYSFLVIAPQFKKRPAPWEVRSVLDFARRRWRVDATRVYVTGLSMGGGSTFDWSAVYGQLAAAIVPVCAGTKPTKEMCARIASKNLPIWGLYSTRDALVTVQWGRDFFNWIDAANPSFATRTKLTVWTDADHETTWARAFNPGTVIGGYNIYQWMLLFKRG